MLTLIKNSNELTLAGKVTRFIEQTFDYTKTSTFDDNEKITTHLYSVYKNIEVGVNVRIAEYSETVIVDSVWGEFNESLVRAETDYFKSLPFCNVDYDTNFDVYIIKLEIIQFGEREIEAISRLMDINWFHRV